MRLAPWPASETLNRSCHSLITNYGICFAARSANAHLAQCRRVILFENGTHSLAVNVCSLVNDQ
jgi:hypothetical protein